MDTTDQTKEEFDQLREVEVYRELYHDDGYQAERWRRLLSSFHEKFVDQTPRYFSSPGRTELCGNHTDHSGGIVLAAAVDLDSIAAVAANDRGMVTVYSEGFDSPFIVDLRKLGQVESEIGTTAALIRGVAASLRENGFNIGGFDACITSDVLIGSGLSSSASIELLIGMIFNSLYNDSSIEAEILAVAGQYAENNYFGKPSGLMDQIACAVGGVVQIDFIGSTPQIKRIGSGISGSEHLLAVVNTGGSHADLTEDYAAIPREIKAVATALGKEKAGELVLEDLLSALPRLRATAGDRAIVRTLHFLNENKRVSFQVGAVEQGNFSRFLELANDSGDSSWQLLQNCYSPGSDKEQGIVLALALTRDFLRGKEGASRVHGGGFAGTIQAWIPRDAIGEFRTLMEPIFGQGSVVVLNIRERGVCEL